MDSTLLIRRIWSSGGTPSGFASREPARWIDRIEPLQLIHHKLCIAAPHGQYFVNQADLVKRWQNFRIRRARSEDYSSIREDDNHGSVRRIEAYDNVPVTRQVLGERCEVCRQSSSASPHNHNRV